MDYKQSIINFCLTRQKENGGFAATPYLPATLEDTYFSLATLRKLEVCFSKLSKTIIFLEKYIEIPLSPRLSFFLKRCLTWLGKNYDPKNIIVSQNPDLEEIYYLKFLGKRDIEIQLALSSPTVKELYFLAELAPEKARDFIDYVKKAQNPDGGFGFFPGTTSFLENTYYAFFFLKKFDENPIYLKELKHFLFSCFRQGGFARAPQGVPFLESTYFGTSLLVDGNIGTIAN